MPVQVDERVTVDFGINPSNNATPGTPGTVYGTSPTGVAVSQYADPETFVGSDTDPRIDADDEIVFMAADAGDRSPRGARRAGRVAISDPVRGGRTFLYFDEAKSARRAARAADYVKYDFRLASGDYRSTYLRADGPNPESSRIRTDHYSAGFSDRWFYDELRIRAGGASGAEILDGYKFGFGPGACSRSEATFSDSEGAFVANIDGPVRAIRSYVGANSGPLTQRTHYFYDSRHEIVTDLRVHAITGTLIYHDLSEAGIGMTFLNSRTSGGVPVDGVEDTINPAVAEWRLWTGEQGSLFAADRFVASFNDDVPASGREFYLDDSTPSFQQCWGDQLALGQAGFHTTAQIPNTDPRMSPAESMRTTTTQILAEPATGPVEAGRWSRELDSPLRVR